MKAFSGKHALGSDPGVETGLPQKMRQIETRAFLNARAR
jgi:hypothetical protein